MSVSRFRSVDSFERKLEDAQKVLGLQPRDYVPVQYASESSFLGEALKFAPTLLLIGGYFLMMRMMGGGAGGGSGGAGGGIGGMFNIGKSKVKKEKHSSFSF